MTEHKDLAVSHLSPRTDAEDGEVETSVTVDDLLFDRRDEWADLIFEHEPVIHPGAPSSWVSCTACEFETSAEDDDPHEDGRRFGLHVLSFIEADIGSTLSKPAAPVSPAPVGDAATQTPVSLEVADDAPTGTAPVGDMDADS